MKSSGRAPANIKRCFGAAVVLKKRDRACSKLLALVLYSAGETDGFKRIEDQAPRNGFGAASVFSGRLR